MGTQDELIRGVDNLVNIMVASIHDHPYISIHGDRPKLWFGNPKRHSVCVHKQTFHSQYFRYFVYESAWGEYRLRDDYLRSIGVLLNE